MSATLGSRGGLHVGSWGIDRVSRQMMWMGVRAVPRSTLLAGGALVCAAVFACGNAHPAPQTSPSTRPQTSATPRPSPLGKSYVAADLPAVVPTAAQMAGWQTATRPDLTGPFTGTTNTNPQENPKPAPGLSSGYRQTIGDPGGPGLNTVRTILELFNSAGEAQGALGPTLKGYEFAGYSQVADASRLGLGPDAAARSGSNVPAAPQFAQGTVKQGLASVWRSGNLVLIQVVGGDSGVTTDAAAKWAQVVNGNAESRG